MCLMCAHLRGGVRKIDNAAVRVDKHTMLQNLLKCELCLFVLKRIVVTLGL